VCRIAVLSAAHVCLCLLWLSVPPRMYSNVPSSGISSDIDTRKVHVGTYTLIIQEYQIIAEISFAIYRPVFAYKCHFRCVGREKFHSVRFDVFTAVTMKNVVFWDIKTQFVLHRRHITSPLHSPAG
jgi:hypothetical protein